MTDLAKNPAGKYNGNEQKYVLQMLDHDNHRSEKPWVTRFEEAFCKRFGVNYAISVNSGTSGLHAAMFAAGVGPGDEVISPALTVIMDTYAALHTGATPVYADIDPDTLTIDPKDVAKKITPRTKAIIVVSLQGLSVDMDPIMELAKKHNLIVVEDSAQTVLGSYKGKLPGTIGHINVFSFENKKHLTCGSEGGMIVSNDEKLAQRARKFAGIGYKHMTAAAGRTSLALSNVQDPAYERFDTIGLNYRMNELSAAVGLAQLERVDEIVTRRQKVAALFRKAVKGCAWLIEQTIPQGYEHSHYTYTVKFYGDKRFGVSWKDFYNQYLAMGGDGFYGACKVPYLEPALKGKTINGTHFREGLCQVAEFIQPRIMQFKTNYRDLGVAQKKAEILHDLVLKISRR